MSKHDLKAVKLQVERLINKILGSKIFSHNPIVYTSDDFDMSDPLTLITRAYGEANFGNGRPDVSLWNGSPIDDGAYVTHPIDGIEYMFRSTVDGNTTEPTLNGGGGPAWTDLGSSGVFPNWSIFDSYPIGELVMYSGIQGDIVYRSKSIEAGHNPEADVTNIFWEPVGDNVDFFDPGNSYDFHQIVLDFNNDLRRYLSNTGNNTFPLDGNIEGAWKLIGPLSYVPDTPLTFNQGNLVEVYEGNYRLSFDLPDDKSITAIQIEQGFLTHWLNVSQAVKNDNNIPNTIIEGFDNNSPQTITIKIG